MMLKMLSTTFFSVNGTDKGTVWTHASHLKQVSHNKQVTFYFFLYIFFHVPSHRKHPHTPSILFCPLKNFFFAQEIVDLCHVYIGVKFFSLNFVTEHQPSSFLFYLFFFFVYYFTRCIQCWARVILLYIFGC